MGGSKTGVAEDLDLEDRSLTVAPRKRVAGCGAVTGCGLGIGPRRTGVVGPGHFVEHFDGEPKNGS